jgi:hypothetical protein
LVAVSAGFKHPLAPSRSDHFSEMPAQPVFVMPAVQLRQANILDQSGIDADPT